MEVKKREIGTMRHRRMQEDISTSIERRALNISLILDPSLWYT